MEESEVTLMVMRKTCFLDKVLKSFSELDSEKILATYQGKSGLKEP